MKVTMIKINNYKSIGENKNKFNELIESIKNSEKKMFINFPYIDDLIMRLKNSQYSFKEELTENWEICKKLLLSYHNYLPKFFFIDDYSLKSDYTKEELKKDNTPEIITFKKMLTASDINFDKIFTNILK